MFWDLMLIQLSCVLVTDVAGAVEGILEPLVKKVTGARVGKLGKPFNCSLCQTFWLGLLYLILTHQLGIASFALLLAVSCTARVTLALYHLCEDFVLKMVDVLYDYFKL